MRIGTSKLSATQSRKIALIVLTSFLCFMVLASTAVGGYYVGIRSKSDHASSAAPLSLLHTRATGQGSEADFGIFWQAWNTVGENFFGTKDSKKQVDGAISGMVASLGDPYTVYLAPDENKMFMSDLEGNFGGIGAELTIKNSALTIMSVLDDTPAMRAGLKSQDIVYQIDGKKSADLSFADALKAIRGTAGSTVKLTIVRSGVDKPFDVPIVRAIITVKSVKTDSLGATKELAYIRVNQFGQDTADLFKAALQNAKDTGKKGLIIDLRDDPGGYLETAVDTIGMVVPQKPAGDKVLQDRTAVLERFKDGTQNNHTTSEPVISDTLPMAVLINSGSASASEIFAGAMRDYKRATLIGTKSFGKGSVQELHDLTNGGSIKVTIAKWFTPLGVGIDGKGIDPDTVIALPDDATQGVGDIQVQKAIETLERSM